MMPGAPKNPSAAIVTSLAPSPGIAKAQFEVSGLNERRDKDICLSLRRRKPVPPAWGRAVGSTGAESGKTCPQG